MVNGKLQKEHAIVWIASILFISLSAHISITLPISEKGIPFTAQSYVIFVVAGLLSPRLFLGVIISYLFLGIAGLPVFADGTSGWEKIQGASGGFLYGFVVSGVAIAYCLQNAERPSLSKIITTMIMGSILLFICGLGQLAVKFGGEKALEYGLYPFWKMGLFKAFLAAITVFGVQRWRSSRL